MVNYDGLYNKEYFGDKLSENHFYDKKLHFRIVENGTILPYKNVPGTAGFGGIVDEKGNYISTSFYNASAGGAYTPNEEIRNVPATVIYLGMFIDVWGHCLTDNLQRIWFLDSEPYKRHFKEYPVVFTPARGVTLNFFKLLKILDIDIEKFYSITSPTKFQNIIVPDGSFFWDEKLKRNMISNEYVETLNKIKDFSLKHKQPISQKKFYFFYGRNHIGEERIARYFQSKGYTVIQPEQYSLEDQLNIFANCESLVSTAGSCSHNMIFMKDDLDVFLIPRAGYLTGFQEALNETYKQNITYIDSTLSIFTRKKQWEGPFCYILSENLRKYFGDDITEKYTEEDFATFLAYVRTAKNQGLSENPNELAYLKDILPEFISQLKTREDLMQKFGVGFK